MEIKYFYQFEIIIYNIIYKFIFARITHLINKELILRAFSLHMLFEIHKNFEIFENLLLKLEN